MDIKENISFTYISKASTIFIYGMIVCTCSLIVVTFLKNQHYYTIIFILFTLLLIYVNSKDGDSKINYSIAIVVFGCLLYSTEIMFVLYPKIFSVESRISKIKKKGIIYDERTKYEVINDYKTQGETYYPTISPSSFIHGKGIVINSTKILPLSGLSNKKHVFGNENGKWITFTSDDYGFHNPRYSWHENIDILIIGDSFAMGAYVPNEDNIAAIIRNKGYKVVTLGYNSNGPLIEYATLKEYARYLKPKVILWFYFEGNDLSDLRNELSSDILSEYYKDNNYNQSLLKLRDKINVKLIDYYDNKKAKHENNINNIYQRIKHTAKLTNIRRKLYHITTPPLEEFKNILYKANKYITEELGSKLYFVYLPAYDRYSEKIHYQWRDMQYRNKIISTVNSLEIEMIDMHRLVFAKYDNPKSLFPYELFGHYNSIGYRLIANKIVNNIK